MTLITPGGAQKHGPLDLRAPTLCLVAQGAVSGFLALGFQGFGNSLSDMPSEVFGAKSFEGF